MTRTERGCGCRIDWAYEETTAEPPIIYCPLHAAAEQTLKQKEAFRLMALHASDCPTCGERGTDHCREFERLETDVIAVVEGWDAAGEDV